jgi:hypothetical protein
MGVFETLIENMQRMEFFQYLFPFLLALAIVYGLLTYALKEQLSKSARGLISIIVAFFVMLYSSWNVAIVSFFANISGYWLVAGSGILFLVILLALVGFKPQEIMVSGGKPTKIGWAFLVAIIFIAIMIFFGAGSSLVAGMVPGWATTSEFWTAVFVIIIIIIVVAWLAAGEGGGEGGEKGK